MKKLHTPLQKLETLHKEKTMDISKKVKSRRLEMKMTQDELAEKLGYKGRSSINNIEKGKSSVPIDKIEELSDALHVSPIYFISSGNDLADVIAERFRGVRFAREEISMITDFIDFVIHRKITE